MSSNVIRVDFGKPKDDFFDDDRPIHRLTITWQSPRWFHLLARRLRPETPIGFDPPQ
jgi:hypothetical protein